MIDVVHSWFIYSPELVVTQRTSNTLHPGLPFKAASLEGEKDKAQKMLTLYKVMN